MTKAIGLPDHKTVEEITLALKTFVSLLWINVDNTLEITINELNVDNLTHQKMCRECHRDALDWVKKSFLFQVMTSTEC